MDFLFLLADRRPYQNAKHTIDMKSSAPSVTPTPIPALAPVERPWPGGNGDVVLWDEDMLELEVEEDEEEVELDEPVGVPVGAVLLVDYI